MVRSMKTAVFLVVMAMIVFLSMVQLLGEEARPVVQEDLKQDRVYAYRDWQSMGVQVQPGDRVVIEADGTWLYTPDEYHGPAGSRRYRAPTFYPLPGVPGGALIGRIGDTGTPFYVGKHNALEATASGLLYLRIDDDILSDNEGSVAVNVSVQRD
jgi:hypothetical protein